MLDILKNLDTVNYIVQDCIANGFKRELTVRNSFYVGEGYAVDTASAKGNALSLRIRTDTMQTLCTVLFEKTCFYIRYNHKLFFKYNLKTDMCTCNLFDEPFSLHEMQSTFLMQNNIGFGIDFSGDFCYNTMIETISLCRRGHDGYLSFIQTKN